MALARFATCCRLSPTILARKTLSVGPSSMMATMQPMTPEQHLIAREEYFDKNRRLKRPLSPHLTIYQPQLTALLSITHRGTGCYMSMLLSGFAIATVALPASFPTYLEMLSNMHFGTPIIFLAKSALAWPFAYHMLNGLRHLAWDAGYGFKMSDLYKSGYAVLGLSFVIAAALASL